MAQRVGRGIALLFHDRGTRRGWVVNSTPRPHFTPGKDPNKLPYFSIDNAHPKLFDIPFDVQITRMTYFSIDNAHDAN